MVLSKSLFGKGYTAHIVLLILNIKFVIYVHNIVSKYKLDTKEL